MMTVMSALFFCCGAARFSEKTEENGQKRFVCSFCHACVRTTMRALGPSHACNDIRIGDGLEVMDVMP
jgi:hypothetical protein